MLYLVMSVLLLGSFGITANAATAQFARIISINGEATVKLAGGSKTIPAYSNMILKQGDEISTGDNGSLTLQVSLPESVRTIGPNSRATIAKLTLSDSGYQFGIKLWAGSMWSSVNSLKGSDADFVETPGSKLNVRGTNFLVIVNPDGSLSVSVASGLVAATLGSGSQIHTPVLVAPTQQLNVLPDDLPKRMQDALSIINVSDLARRTDPSILKAFIVSAPSIIEENNELLKDLQESLDKEVPPLIQRDGVLSDLSVASQNQLDAYNANLDQLVSIVAQAAVRLSPSDSAELSQLIESINELISGTVQDIRLDNDASLDPLAGIDPASVEDKQVEQDRLTALREEIERDRSRLESELADKLGASLVSIIDRQKRIIAANKTILEELQKTAENEYISTLSQEELAKYQKAKLQLNSPVNSAPISPTPESPSSPVSSTGISLTKTNVSDDGFYLAINLKQFTGANSFYAAEFHFITDPLIEADTTTGRMLNDFFFNPENSADILKSVKGTVGQSSTVQTETIYAVTQFGVNTNVSIADGILAYVPFIARGSGTIKLSYVKIVNSTGTTILELNEGSTGLPPAIVISNLKSCILNHPNPIPRSSYDFIPQISVYSSRYRYRV